MTVETVVRNDVVFATGGERDLRCDVYSPAEAAERAPGVLLVHGGAWRMGDRSVMTGYGHALAAQGFVCVASEYRLTPESPWPAHIHDVKAAIRWVRANADELNIDEARIAVLGRSAGGHLALLAAGTPNHPDLEGEGGNPGVGTEVAAVVGIFPPTVFHPDGQRVPGGTAASALIQETATEDALRLASPLHQITRDYPPTFLLHGTGDKVVPPSASMVMYQALVAAGVPVEMHMYAGQAHGFAGRPDFLDLCALEIGHFLHRCFAPTTDDPQVALSAAPARA